jgi:hypothetical protein
VLDGKELTKVQLSDISTIGDIPGEQYCCPRVAEWLTNEQKVLLRQRFSD